MKILDRYIYRKLLIYTAIILPSITVVTILVELIELFRKIKLFDIKLILLYILYKIPEKVYFMLPITLVIVTALFARDLIKSKEIYPVLLNGISLKSLGIRFFLFSFAFSILQLLNLEIILPEAQHKSEKLYKILRKKEDTEKNKLIAFNMWIAIDKKTFMYFDVLDLNRKNGKNGIIVKLDNEFKPVLRVSGSSFHVFNNKIVFFNGKLVNLKNMYDFSVITFKKYPLFLDLDLNSFKELISIKKPISLRELYKTATIAKKYGYPASYYLSRFYQKLSTVIAPFVLVFALYPFMWSLKTEYIGIILGLLVFYWYGTGFITSLTEGNVIPYYSVFIVDLFYILIGFIFLRKLTFHEF